jgi:hypothetical protein
MNSCLLPTPKIKLLMILTDSFNSQDRQCAPCDFVETSLHYRQVLSRLTVRVSTKSCQMSFDYISISLQFPVRTPPTNLQPSSRKEFDVSWEEVSTTHDLVIQAVGHPLPDPLQGYSLSITSLTCSFKSCHKAVLRNSFTGIRTYLTRASRDLSFMFVSGDFLEHFSWFHFIYLLVYIISQTC